MDAVQTLLKLYASALQTYNESIKPAMVPVMAHLETLTPNQRLFLVIAAVLLLLLVFYRFLRTAMRLLLKLTWMVLQLSFIAVLVAVVLNRKDDIMVRLGEWTARFGAHAS